MPTSRPRAAAARGAPSRCRGASATGRRPIPPVPARPRRGSRQRPRVLAASSRNGRPAPRSRGTCRSWRRPATAARRRPAGPGALPRRRRPRSCRDPLDLTLPARSASIVARPRRTPRPACRWPGVQQCRVRLALVPAAEQQDHGAVHAAQGDARRADVRRLRVVDPEHAAGFGDNLEAVLQARERAQPSATAPVAAPAELRRQCRRQRIGAIVCAEHTQLALVQQSRLRAGQAQAQVPHRRPSHPPRRARAGC
jgi:hypothetical protein